MRAFVHCLLVVAWSVSVSSRPAIAQPVFNGDPIDPATHQPYSILPGAPLIYPGVDGKFGTADDLVDTNLIGDVDIVIRTGGTFMTVVIPPPASGVGAAPVIIAGGHHGHVGSEAPFQLIVSDGATMPAAGRPLLGPDLNARRALLFAFADLDGDGFIGPTAASSPSDIQIERQEALTFVGRVMAEIQNGVATGTIGVSMGAPASTGGLGIVVAGGAATGATPNLYADGPWVATSLPYLIPLTQGAVVGGENTGPIDPVGLVDLELSGGAVYLPAPNNPNFGTPFAVPLDGSDVTVDLLRSNSAAAVGASFGQSIDRATFVATWGTVLRPAVDGSGKRDLIAAVDSISLPADGPGNTQTVLVYPADLLGNPTDPPSGGLNIVLEASPGLKIIAPDSDGDPRREPITFGSASYSTVVLDDAGLAVNGTANEYLVAVRSGVPTGRLDVTISAGAGGGSSPLLGATATLQHGRKVGRDHLGVHTVFADDGSVNPATQTMAIVVSTDAGSVYQRSFGVGSLHSRKGKVFSFRDRNTNLFLRRSKQGPPTFTLDLRNGKIDLSAVPAGVATLSVAVEIGALSNQLSLSCTANAKATLSHCAP
ncbi:MAG: hypothetical protein HY270_10820 [Deltaproteobacteria bacterium]|nr:hypothetical protein [Deltaproteobacteria bacterium]